MLLRVLKKKCPEVKEMKILTVCKTLSDRRSLHEFLERKAGSAVQGENSAPKRLSEAEPDLERKKWE